MLNSTQARIVLGGGLRRSWILEHSVRSVSANDEMTSNL